jgi:hypothetical protein
MLELAGAIADRVVVNLVTPELVPVMKVPVALGAERAGRPAPEIVVWVMAGSQEHALPRTARLLRAYVDAPGYSHRLEQAGLDRVARNDPETAAERLGAFGAEPLTRRLDQLAVAGAAEVALVVSGADPGASDLLGQVRAR